MNASRLGLACYHTGDPKRDRGEIEATFNEAFDAGINFFDTADIFDRGESERVLGEVFRGRRDQVIICSKAGKNYGAGLTVKKILGPRLKPLLGRLGIGRATMSAVRKASPSTNFEAGYIRDAIEGSLRRLGTDYLDLFLLHAPPMEVLEEGAIFDTMETLRRAGMIRYYGVSCGHLAEYEETRASLAYPEVCAVKIGINPLQSGPGEKTLPLTLAKNVAVIAREPFCRGRIFSDPRLCELLSGNPERTAAQTALQFALPPEAGGIVTTGMTSRPRLRENLGALSAPPLSEQERAQLAAYAAPAASGGAAAS